MRILALTNLYPNPLQPTRATFNRQQFRALAQRHAVHVISPISWTDELRARIAGRPPLPSTRRVVCDGIDVDHPRFLFTPKLMRGLHGHFYLRSVGKSVYRAVVNFLPDLALAAWAYPDGWAAVTLARRHDLPLVIKVHGCDVLCGGEGLDLHPKRRQRTIEALTQADGIVAVSRDLARHVVDLGVDPRKVRVIYDGIDTVRFRPGPRDQARQRLGLSTHDRMILFIGALADVKAPNMLVDACGLLRDRGEPFACHMIGQGPLRMPLQQQIARLGLADRVKLVGGFPHEHLPDWYRACNVFVLPSRSEGVPCVLLESMACGRPFVASRVGGIPEVAPPGYSELVAPGDARMLADAIARVLSRPRSSAEALWTRSHEQAADDLTAFFQQILDTRRVASNASRATPRRHAIFETLHLRLP